MSFTPSTVDEASLRVALRSDTHNAVDRRVASVVDSCDLVVHAGDIGSPEVLAQLLPKSGRVFAVRGNNDTLDQWPPGTERCLRILPESLSLDLPGGVLVVVHGIAPARLPGGIKSCASATPKRGRLCTGIHTDYWSMMPRCPGCSTRVQQVIRAPKAHRPVWC